MSSNQDQTRLAHKIVMDVLKGLHPITGRPYLKRSSKDQSEVLQAAIRSYSEMDLSGQVSSLVEDLYMQTKWSEERTETWIKIMKRAVCDDYEIGLSINDIAEDYGISAKRVLAILIDEGKLSEKEAVFFIRSLQQTSILKISVDNASSGVINLNHYR